MPLPSPSPSRTVDYAAMETAIEDKISSGSLSLSTINAVLVSVGGETKVANDLTQECAEFVAPEYVLRRSSNCAP
jgi:hypothetical protein